MRYLITTCICTCLTRIKSVFKRSKCILLQNQETKGSSDFQLHSFLSDETSPAVSDDRKPKIKQRSKWLAKWKDWRIRRDGKFQPNGKWKMTEKLFLLSDQRLSAAQGGLWLRNWNCANKEERKSANSLMPIKELADTTLAPSAGSSILLR